MAPLVALILLVLFATLFAASLRRSRELFVLSVRDAEVVQKRGHIPPALLQDLRDIFANVSARGTLRVIAQQGVPVLDARGSFTPETLQRARNVLGLYSLARLRAGRSSNSGV